MEAAEVNYTIWGVEGIPYKIYVGLSGEADQLPLAPEEYSSKDTTPRGTPKTKSGATTPGEQPTQMAVPERARPSKREPASSGQPPKTATGSASAVNPGTSPFVLTYTLLGMGLLLGIFLVTPPTHRDDTSVPGKR
jgi:hypothetical protein